MYLTMHWMILHKHLPQYFLSPYTVKECHGLCDTSWRFRTLFYMLCSDNRSSIAGFFLADGWSIRVCVCVTVPHIPASWALTRVCFPAGSISGSSGRSPLTCAGLCGWWQPLGPSMCSTTTRSMFDFTTVSYGVRGCQIHIIIIQNW